MADIENQMPGWVDQYNVPGFPGIPSYARPNLMNAINLAVLTYKHSPPFRELAYYTAATYVAQVATRFAAVEKHDNRLTTSTENSRAKRTNIPQSVGTGGGRRQPDDQTKKIRTKRKIFRKKYKKRYT